MMKFLAVATSAMFLAGGAQAASPEPSDRIPAQFHGLWYADDEEGRSQCALYKKGTTLGPDDNFLVGLVSAVVIAPALFHDVAEYGEGDFHRPFSVMPSGEDVVTIKAATTFDGNDEIAGYAILVLTRNGEDKLYVTGGSIGDGDAVKRPLNNETLFRCADKPDSPQYSDNPPD